MIPTTEISGGILDGLIVYVAILGTLLLIATWLRIKIPLLRKYHIPAALVAGILGLILGPYFIGLIPAHVTNCWSALAGRLIVFVFAPMMMGGSNTKIGKDMVKRVGGACCFSYALTALQYAVPIWLGIVLLTPAFGVSPLFSTIVEQGWAGGHGTAGGMGIVFEEIGWADGQSLATTSATAGLLYGIIGGVVLINIGVKRGWTAVLTESTGLRSDEKELFPGEEQREDTRSGISSGVIDNLAFHAALICIAALIGWVLNKALKLYLNISVAWFVTALFGGLLLWQLVIKRTSLAGAVNKATFTRIQGLSLEFLVAGAVASVKIPVVIAYAAPLVIQQVLMAVIMWFIMTWYTRRLFGRFWFENSMVLFGTYTGVVATGLLLLKTCDPEFKSDATTIMAARSPFTTWALGGGILTSLTPVWITQYGAFRVGLGYTALLIVGLILPRVFGCWHPVEKKPKPTA